MATQAHRERHPEAARPTRATCRLTDAPEDLAVAAALLQRGGLVAFPTETVYGLGASLHDEAAVRRVFTVKGRPADNPLIVHLAASDQLDQVAATITPLARRLAAASWPGPLTLVLDARPEVPTVATGGLDTVAVRVPAHPVALALLEALDAPLVAPSANRSGRPSPTTAAHVLADLAGDLDAVVDGGDCRLGVESTVVDTRGSTPVVLREGMVTREDLGLGVDETAAGEADAGRLARSPGTRYRHYAPRCEVVIAPVGRGAVQAVGLAQAGTRVGLVAPEVGDAARHGVLVIAAPADAAALGAVLYRALRQAEDADIEVVVVEAVAPTGVGRAVMDRLRRAAAGS